MLLHCDTGSHNVSTSVVHEQSTDNTRKGSMAFIISVVDESQQSSSKRSHGNLRERASAERDPGLVSILW